VAAGARLAADQPIKVAVPEPYRDGPGVLPARRNECPSKPTPQMGLLQQPVRSLPRRASRLSADVAREIENALDGRSAAAVTFDNRTVTLPQTLGGSDVKYSDGRTTLYLDGARALLETSGLVFARGCVQR
jgi:hypothetical protein